MATKFDGIDTPYRVDESLPWVPLGQCSDRASVRLYAANPGRGEVVLLLRAAPGVEFPPHRSTGMTTIYTLQGRWKYLEHDWVAGPGSVVIAPAGDRHTPRIQPDGTDDAMLFVVADGDLCLLDSDDRIVAVRNWRSAIDLYEQHCRTRGIAPHGLTRQGC